MMNSPELKKLLVRSLDADGDSAESSRKLEEAGVSFSFGEDFLSRVMEKISRRGIVVVSETEFVKDVKYVFYRIALPGIAAIILLLISIFLMEGSVSVNSFLGLGDTYDESIICLLTGN